MKIKVCGIRDIENVRELVKLPIDYMGFIFYAKSPRFVNNNIHPEILSLLEKNEIKKVGVFVNLPLEETIMIAQQNGLDVIQCHGDENADYCQALKDVGFAVFKAFRVNEQFDFSVLKTFHSSCNYYLFDTDTKSYGGSGKKFNWNILKKYTGDKEIILSGGIGIGDEAIIHELTGVKIHAIDINSKFEISPAFKNVQLISNFIANLTRNLKL